MTKGADFEAGPSPEDTRERLSLPVVEAVAPRARARWRERRLDAPPFAEACRRLEASADRLVLYRNSFSPGHVPRP